LRVSWKFTSHLDIYNVCLTFIEQVRTVWHSRCSYLRFVVQDLAGAGLPDRTTFD
jgi:hypothetical protein